MRYLKQNTDSYVSIGMTLDKTAGYGNEDALTVTSFSGVIVKETQASATSHTDFTPSATAGNDWGMVAVGHGGMYQLKIPDSEIDFVGSCIVAVWYDAEALPVWHEFMVLPAQVWNSLMGTDYLDVSAVQLSGTSLTGRDIGASVLLSSGSGAGQLDFTSGVVKSNLSQILGTALTETAGQIAAAFKKFFDKATPTGTINSLPDAVAGATGGLPTTNGTKVNQTVDLTAGQSIACSDKTGFALSTSGVTAVQTGLATPTNITAGTITTVTNLTNAPTNGDFTATMKTSITSAVPTVAQIADGACDEVITTGHAVSGSLAAIINAIKAKTDTVGGAGSVTWPVTINDGTDPIDGAEVWVTTDSDGEDVVAYGVTNALGVFSFLLDAGTYYTWTKKSGYTFTNPTTMVVS